VFCDERDPISSGLTGEVRTGPGSRNLVARCRPARAAVVHCLVSMWALEAAVGPTGVVTGDGTAAATLSGWDVETDVAAPPPHTSLDPGIPRKPCVADGVEVVPGEGRTPGGCKVGGNAGGGM
jgi:hypothetical protein